LKATIYVVGIIGSLLVYGIWQERIMDQAYGQDYFAISAFLVLFNRVFGIAFALLMIPIMGESFRSQASLWKYMFMALATVTASVCQYEALKYVSFSVQILGKSCKMLPIMMWGQFVWTTKYRLVDWIVAPLVTAGVIWFMLSGPVQPDHHDGNTWYGILLLAGFVAFDSFTTIFQERLFTEAKTSKYNQMLYINLFAAIISLGTCWIGGEHWPWGELEVAFKFFQTHKSAWEHASILSAAAVLAQWFIYSQVQEFGALAFAATMNLRQMASVILSYVIFDHAIKGMQIAGLCIVFTALAMQSGAGLQAKADPEKTSLLNQDADKAVATITTNVRKSMIGAASCMPCMARKGIPK
jgi:adenosine 3'-phospho 5'-phosphosulfate transporter B2